MKSISPLSSIVLSILLFTGCESGTLGIYVYPQAIKVSEAPEVSGLAERANSFEVVGYLPRYQISNVDPSIAENLTDLIYFTLWPQSNGTLTEDALIPSHREFLRRVKAMGVRVLIGVTDHTKRGPLLKIAQSTQLRERFSERLATYLVENGFDGADFDWEYPAESDLPHYTVLLRDVKEAFRGKNLKLTVAVSPSRPLEKQAYEYADRVHGMMYDDWGQHSTLANSSYHVQEMIAQGVDPKKLQLGVPFYGRGYTKRGPSWDSALSYRSLRERYALKPDQDTVSGYYFNGIETIQEKVLYAKNTGLSGVMVWELGQDTNDNSSLLKAISDVARRFN